MDGIKRCEMFRAIRKRLCENNGIPFIEEECPNPNKECIGTCPACDYWLKRINNCLATKCLSGDKIDYSGVKEIYESYITSGRIDSDLDSVIVDGYFLPPEKDEKERERRLALLQLEREKLELEEESEETLRGVIRPDEWELRGRVVPDTEVNKVDEEKMKALDELRLRLEQERLEEERALQRKVMPDERQMGVIEPEADEKKLVDRLEAKMRGINGKKHCPVCGQELPDEFRVCPYCGQTL